MTNELNEILRKLRVVKNYSQDYVAEKIDVSLSTYSRYEAGKVEIDFNSVYKLADLYKMTLDELVHYNDPDFKIEESRSAYQKRWTVQVMVALDGTIETLETWVKKLGAINASI